MSYEPKKHPLNVRGKYYVTEDCLACENCQDAAPNNFRYVAPNNFRYEGWLTYVFKQPSTPEEEEQCHQAVLGCPMEAIRDDGEIATH